MATLQQLEQALIRADAAGDMDAARQLAAAIKSMRAQPQQAQEQPGLMSQIGRQVGLTGRYAMEGVANAVGVVTNPVTAIMEQATGRDFQTVPELAVSAADRMGLPKPQGEMEQVVGAASRGVAGAVPFIGAGAAMSNAASPVTQAVGRSLAAQPGAQLASNAGGAGAAEMVNQEGGGPAAQVAASLAGGMAGAGLLNKATTIRQAMAAPKAPAPQIVQDARNANVPLMTSDVQPPSTFMGRFAQGAGEKVPYAGTAGMRANQQAARVEAVKRLATDIGGDLDKLPDQAIAQSLRTGRAAEVQKYVDLKQGVFDKLSRKDAEIAVDDYLNGSKSVDELSEYLSKVFGAKQDGKGLRYGKNGNRSSYYKLPNGKTLRISDHTARNNVGSVADIDLVIDPEFTSAELSLNKLDKLKTSVLDTDSATFDFSGSGAMTDVKGKQISGWWAFDGDTKKMSSALANAIKKASDDGSPSKYLDDYMTGKSGASMPTVNVTKHIDEEIARLQALGTRDFDPLVAKLEDFKSAIQGKTINQVEELRQQLGQKLGSDEFTSIRGAAEKVLRSTYGALKSDIESFIKTSAGDRDVTKWKVADKRLTGLIGELESTAFKRALDKGDITPETVRNVLFSKNRSDVQRLYKTLTPEGRAAARTAIIQDAVEKAGGLEQISPQKFATQLEKRSAQTGIFFNQDQRKQAEGLIRVVKATQRASEAAAAPMTGYQAVPVVGAAFLTDLFGGAGAGLASGASIGAAARVYESKMVRDLLIKMSSVKPNTPEEGAIVRRVIPMIQQMTKPQEEKE